VSRRSRPRRPDRREIAQEWFPRLPPPLGADGLRPAPNGLVGISLRPLAAALGTSDRMLVHYFDSTDKLVGLVLAASHPDIPDLLARGGDDDQPGGPGDAGSADRTDEGGARPPVAAASRLWINLTCDGPQRSRSACCSR
jgi:hypothetical protein